MGPLTFSVNEVKTALTVALIVVPCNLLIILLFKKAGPKIPKNSTKYELLEKEIKVVGELNFYYENTFVSNIFIYINVY